MELASTVVEYTPAWSKALGGTSERALYSSRVGAQVSVATPSHEIALS